MSWLTLSLLTRELLRDLYWPLRAAEGLHQKVSWPVQYQRAAPARKPARTHSRLHASLNRKGRDDMASTTELEQRQGPRRTPSEILPADARKTAANWIDPGQRRS